jgi:hypothetical protein
VKKRKEKKQRELKRESGKREIRETESSTGSPLEKNVHTQVPEVDSVLVHVGEHIDSGEMMTRTEQFSHKRWDHHTFQVTCCFAHLTKRKGKKTTTTTTKQQQNKQTNHTPRG